jgi:Uma2 family endonuclease
MSGVNHSTPGPLQAPDTDPYRYGFRDEPVLQPDGTYEWEPIALTVADQLHPHEGDRFNHGSRHVNSRDYLRNVFHYRVEDDPTALVLSNQGILWDNPELKHHAPDVAVIFGVRRRLADWILFDVAAEGTRPRLIVEIVTPMFRDNDIVHKFHHYHAARVATYVICDRETGEGPWNVLGYAWQPDRYEPLPRDQRGRVLLADLKLWLGTNGDDLRCYDAETDREMGDYATVARQLTKLDAAHP